MNVSNELTKNVMAWVTLAIVIVIGSIVLVKFKTSSLLCPSGYTFNDSTANTCYETANASNTISANGNLGTSIDTFVSAIGEPQNWVAIVIIALVGFAVLKIFQSRKK